MDKRWKLFQTFTLPSVLAQANQNFCWIVLIDKGTPDLQFHGRITVVRCNSANAAKEAAPRVRNLAMTSFVMTTRLDNDDCLHKDFTRVLQEHFISRHNVCLNFSRQYYLDTETGAVYLHDYYTTTNTISLIEDTAQPIKTVYFAPHPEVGRHAQVINVPTAAAMSMLLVHEENIGNKVYGKPVSSSQQLREGYPFLKSWTRAR
jgi:hypothetical protein